MSNHNDNNKHASKPDKNKATSYLHGRCLPSDKAKWVKQAQSEGMKPMPWVVKVMNENSKNIK